MPLHLTADGSAAAWIAAGASAESVADPSSEPWLTFERGPRGYEAFARLLYLGDPEHPGQEEADGPDLPGDLMEPDVLALAVGTLAPFSRTPDELRFAFWEGHGGPEAATPTVLDLDARAYWLANGSLSDWTGDAQWSGWTPAMLWPADRAWCVTSDVDPHWAGLVGSEAAVAAVCGHPALTAERRARDGALPTYY